MTTDTKAALSLDETLNMLFPMSGLGLLRLDADDHDKFYRRIEGAWRGLDEHTSPLSLFSTQHPAATIRFSGVLFRGGAVGAHWPLTCLWVGLPVKLTLRSATEPRPTVGRDVEVRHADRCHQFRDRARRSSKAVASGL